MGEQEANGSTQQTNSVLVDGSHRYTDVKCLPVIGPGGAHHNYEIVKKKDSEVLLRLSFQNGPIKESGVNGVMDENLIAIVIDRLKGFQSGKYASPYNHGALEHLEWALDELKERTIQRIKRGVEGTHEV